MSRRFGTAGVDIIDITGDQELEDRFLFRVPVVYLFAIVLGWGLNGVWLGTAVDFTGRLLVLYLLYRQGAWRRARIVGDRELVGIRGNSGN